jgi:hypothetical protein|tara:strand:+ start:1623 stop:2279 length:657 start_codon:yes stop_codon:yes gene_type:complete
MLFPSVVLDNFFTDPDLVKDFASKLKYYKASDGRWPGKRTEALHLNHFSFFEYINTKILKVIYPNETINFTASTSFQKIEGNRYPNGGWVHKDKDEITAIIYLSKHKFCGTSLCKRVSLDEHQYVTEEKIKFYKKDKYDPAEVDSINKNNQYYKKILTVNSEYNRLFLFDSHHYHVAESFVDENDKSDRLTLISFISNLKSLDNKILKYGLPESKRCD